MNEKQRAELKTLAENLHLVPAEKFTMLKWGQGQLLPGLDDFGCNYAGCAVGWAPKLIPGCELKLRLDPRASALIPYYDDFDGMTAVQAYFGLRFVEAEYLFHPEEYPSDARTEDDDVPKEVVSARILQFLEDGLIVVDDDWEPEEDEELDEE